MPLKYKLRQNKLTNELSYAAYVQAPSVYLAALVTEIQLRNPTLSTDVINTVIDSLKDVCVEQLSAGNRVTISNFFRISPSIRTRITSPDYSANADDLELNGTVQPDILNKVRESVTFSRIASVEKHPTILSALSALGYQNMLSGLTTFRGNNMQFDKTTDDEGVNLYNTLFEEPNEPLEYGTVTDGTVVFNVPALTEPTNKYQNEYLAKVSTRYTDGGTLRTGTYTTPLRAEMTITTAELDNYNTAGVFIGSGYELELEETKLETATYSAPGDVYRFYIKVNPQVGGEQTSTSAVDFSVGLVNNLGTVSESAPVMIICNPDSQTVTIPCSIPGIGAIGNLTQVEVYVESLIALANMVVDSYGGSMQEYLTLDDSANLPP